jgi:hypothetical protein
VKTVLSEKEIYAKFQEVGISRGGELYLQPRHALDFIRACQENNIAVIGIEGFIYENGQLAPQLDMIADYSSGNETSWNDYKNTRNNSSEHFTRNLLNKKGLILSFVVLSEQEWKNMR